MSDDLEEDLNGLSEHAADDGYATELYGALCNTAWINGGGYRWSCTWRYAGSLVARLRDKGEDYMDFYCGGREGVVSQRIETALDSLGWERVRDDEVAT